MTISERTLRKWRKEALISEYVEHGPGSGSLAQDPKWVVEVSRRILRLTQELLDAHLLHKG
uniref:Uncharacterized protein n=1 Tax=viral metagenome TaxID=1070528 RepID=A0A6M3X691_9ZZZZ